ncbi:hypothetical protein NL50_06505 [Clostridium acetobutylicum]|nr:hypothetical protein NL50_06505 [Clostridium acetobutylicum]
MIGGISMKRDRYIRVPKDTKAMEDYDYGVQEPEQMIEWILNDEEYTILSTLKIFDELNNQCDIIIDDFEEETISFDKLDIANNTINMILNKIQSSQVKDYELVTKLQDMISSAIERKTLIAFDF